MFCDKIKPTGPDPHVFMSCLVPQNTNIIVDFDHFVADTQWYDIDPSVATYVWLFLVHAVCPGSCCTVAYHAIALLLQFVAWSGKRRRSQSWNVNQRGSADCIVYG